MTYPRFLFSSSGHVMLSIIPHIKSATIGDILYLIKTSHISDSLTCIIITHGVSFVKSRGRDLNPQPLLYKSTALPLSYPGEWNYWDLNPDKHIKSVRCCQLHHSSKLGPHNGPVSYHTHGTTEAVQRGLEPLTIRLTGERSTIELPDNMLFLRLR